VNGARIYYEVAGSGPALVLIHGGQMDSRMWDEQFAPLAPSDGVRLDEEVVSTHIGITITIKGMQSMRPLFPH
jgi:hypothetical protein